MEAIDAAISELRQRKNARRRSKKIHQRKELLNEAGAEMLSKDDHSQLMPFKFGQKMSHKQRVAHERMLVTKEKGLVDPGKRPRMSSPSSAEPQAIEEPSSPEVSDDEPSDTEASPAAPSRSPSPEPAASTELWPEVHHTREHTEWDSRIEKVERDEHGHAKIDHERAVAGLFDGIEGAAPAPTKPSTSTRTILRSPDVQTARDALPVAMDESNIIEEVRAHDVLVLTSDTGSGKSTQLPQAVLEYGLCGEGQRIAVTQPRRVAAIALADRVDLELNSGNTDPATATAIAESGRPALTPLTAAHRVRFSSNVAPHTRVVFQTDGILLREISSDPLLKAYDVVVVDEAHERAVQTDVLIGMLALCARRRRSTEGSTEESTLAPLKIIIMSATISAETFTRVFEAQGLDVAPYHVETSPAFSVTEQFTSNKIDSERDVASAGFNALELTDDLGAVVDYTVQVVLGAHQNSKPRDGAWSTMLVFLPGVKEITTAIDKFTEAVGGAKKGTFAALGTGSDAADDEDPAWLAEGEGDGDGPNPTPNPTHPTIKGVPFDLLPLYAALPPAAQQRVFTPVPLGTRRVVFTTNIAETSLTIPDVGVVIDSGLQKMSFTSGATGHTELRVVPISQSSSTQRAGRTGRTCNGTCYHMYPQAAKKTMPMTDEPEIIARADLQQVALTLVARGVDPASFPFPSPPDPARMAAAVATLGELDAVRPVEPTTHGGDSVAVTPLGRRMALLPIPPRVARMVCLACNSATKPAHITTVIHPILTVAATLAVDRPERMLGKKDTRPAPRPADPLAPVFNANVGDHLTLAALVESPERAPGDGRVKANVRRIRAQLSRLVQDNSDDLVPQAAVKGAKPTTTDNAKAINPWLKAKLDDTTKTPILDQLVESVPKRRDMKNKKLANLRRFILAAFTSNLCVQLNTARTVQGTMYKCAAIADPDRFLKIHSESQISRPGSALPQFIVTDSVITLGRADFAPLVTPVECDWVLSVAPPALISEKQTAPVRYDSGVDTVVVEVDRAFNRAMMDGITAHKTLPYPTPISTRTTPTPTVRAQKALAFIYALRTGKVDLDARWRSVLTGAGAGVKMAVVGVRETGTKLEIVPGSDLADLFTFFYSHSVYNVKSLKGLEGGAAGHVKELKDLWRH